MFTQPARGIRHVSVAFGLVSLAWAGEPAVSDRFYNSIRQDDSRDVRQLLKSGADINIRDSHGATPLLYAAEVGSVALMRELLTAGADVNAKTTFGATALMWSVDSAQRVNLLVEKGADVNARSRLGRTPLLIACAHSGNLDVVRLLLSKGAALDVKDDIGNTPLYEAARADDTPLVQFLLEKGSDAKVGNRAAMTPLLFASSYGNQGVVTLADRLTRIATLRSPASRALRNAALVFAGYVPPLTGALARNIAELDN